MKTTLIISAALMIATLMACSNNNTMEETSTIAGEYQTTTGNEAVEPFSASALPSFNIHDENG